MMDVLSQHWHLLLGSGGVLSVLGTALGWIFRRYRRSAARELQPFGSYLAGSARLAIRRRVNRMLVGRIAVRPHANAVLRGDDWTMKIPTSSGNEVLDLDRAYVRLNLAAAAEATIPDDALLAAPGAAVLVFGEPGSGKSSLTRRLFRLALQAAYLEPLASRLPLRVQLGQVDWSTLPGQRDEGLEWLKNLLVEQLTNVHRPRFVLDSFIDGPGIVLLLDGLDEVPGDRLADVERFLADVITPLRRASADTLVLVTARTQLRGVLRVRFTEAFSRTYTLDAFSPADVFAFLRRWNFPADRRFAERHRIFEHLRTNPTLFDMCTNPLVLSMYVAEDAIRTKHSGGAAVRLPDTRALFYDKVVGELLLYRRGDQRAEPEPAGTQLLVTRQELLGRIALDHIADSDDPANSLSLRRAVTAAGQIWRGTEAEAERALAWLAVDTGIVAVQRRGQTLQFIHLTLCEYLAGRELSERGEADLNRVLDDACAPNGRRLWETVVFAVALSKRNLRERAVQRLVANGAASELILRILREVQTYDDPIFLQALTTATKRLATTPVEAWDADWLTQVRLLVSCLADAARLEPIRPVAGLPTQSAWLHDLVRDDSDRLDRVLELYLESSPSEAVRVADQLGILPGLLSEADRLIAALQQPELVALAMHTVAEGAPAARRWAYLLCEAALRYELVAQLLYEEAAPPGLDHLVASVPDERAWHRVGPVAQRFYGTILSLATMATDSEARLIDAVRQVPPRSRRVRKPNVLDAALVSSFGITTILLMGRFRAPVLMIEIIGALAIILQLAGGISIIRLRRRRRITGWGTVRTLLNLDPREGPPVGIVVTRFADDVARMFEGPLGGPIVGVEKERPLVQALAVVNAGWPLAVRTLTPIPPKQRRWWSGRRTGDSADARVRG